MKHVLIALSALGLCLLVWGKFKTPTTGSGSGSSFVQTGETKECYWCKESVKVAALICKHCGKDPANPDSYIGEYEIRKGKNSFKIVLLEGGFVEAWENDVKKEDERGRWVVSNKRIEMTDARGKTAVFKIETNGDLTIVAV